MSAKYVSLEFVMFSNEHVSLCSSGDVGDHVVVMNSRHIAFSGNKWEQKMYSSHTQ